MSLFKEGFFKQPSVTSGISPGAPTVTSTSFDYDVEIHRTPTGFSLRVICTENETTLWDFYNDAKDIFSSSLLFDLTYTASSLEELSQHILNLPFVHLQSSDIRLYLWSKLSDTSTTIKTIAAWITD